MNTMQRSQAFLRKRKVMTVLPLLIIPFITMAFWALGGGKTETMKSSATQDQGLNFKLPQPNLKEDTMADKMSFYDQAKRDSVKLAEQIQNDPYFSSKEDIKDVYMNMEQIAQHPADQYSQSDSTKNGGLKYSPYDKAGIPAEEKLMKKLAEINKVINQPEQESAENTHQKYSGHSNEIGFSSDVNRLESMMEMMNNKDEEDDPEMKQLENTLDKILDIQHPERVKERIREKSILNKESAYPVSKITNKENISLLETNKGKKTDTGFFGMEAQDKLTTDNPSIEAVIHENQTLVNGAVVKLRLANSIYINGIFIPSGTFVFGTAELNAERLEIAISSIRYHQTLFPVKMEVYDLDGLPGIYTPGTITRDVAKQSADNSLQWMELTTPDPSFKAQAAAAGISAAKNLLSRKVKQVKVMVKAGYKVLLKDNTLDK